MKEFTPGMLYLYLHKSSDANGNKWFEFPPGHYNRMSDLLGSAGFDYKVDAIQNITRAYKYSGSLYGHFWANIFTDTPMCAVVTSTKPMNSLDIVDTNCHLMIDRYEIYDDCIIDIGDLEIGFHDGRGFVLTPEHLTQLMFKQAQRLAVNYHEFSYNPELSIEFLDDDGNATGETDHL